MLNTLLRLLLVTAIFQQEMPDRMTAPGADEPFWVSARSATVDGHLEVSTLPPIARTVLESRSRDAAVSAMSAGSTGVSDCEVLSAARHVTDRASSTWRDLLKNAAAIYKGSVSAVTPGFYNGLPSSMLAIHINTAVRQAPGFPSAGGTVYVDYSTTEFRIGSERFCMQSPRRDGFLPQAGDEVLIFAFVPPMSSNRQYLPTSDELLFFGRGQVLSIPAVLAGDSTLPSKTRINDLVKEVQRAERRMR